MFFSFQEQLAAVLGSILLGAALGLFYDVLRAVRREARAGAVLTAVLDTVFWLVLLGALFEYNIVAAPGQSRYYILAGMAGGAAVYFQLLSPACLLILRAAVAGTVKLFYAIVRFIQKVDAACWRLLQYVTEWYQKKPQTPKKFAKTPSIFRRKGIK